MFRDIKDIYHDGKLAYHGVPDPGINILYFYINMPNLDVIMLKKPSEPVCRCCGDHFVECLLIIHEGILRWGFFYTLVRTCYTFVRVLSHVAAKPFPGCQSLYHFSIGILPFRNIAH